MNTNSVKRVHIDGVLYVTLGTFVFLQGYFSTEDASKYMSPAFNFWVNCIVGGILAGASALKMYRSTAFADHQIEKKNGNGGSHGTALQETPKPSGEAKPPVNT